MRRAAEKMISGTYLVCVRLAKVCVLGLACGIVISASAQEADQRQNTIVGIGVCPPWNAQSGEVCKYSVETVVGAFSDRLGIEPSETRLMFNEGASADGLKRTITELANKLDQNDRLIIYANLPSKGIDLIGDGSQSRQVLELWADHEPETADTAIENGIWISAPAFAAMLHTIPAGEVILILDTSNSDTIDPDLLESHSTNLDDRPEVLVTSAGAGQKANYSSDRTIALFAKHLAASLETTTGSLQQAMMLAAAGTRQAAIPICMDLKEKMPVEDPEKNCTQVPEIHDPAGLLAALQLPDLPEDVQN
ncbi:MAG: hypothetical protein ABJN98_13045 [Roseibium sp.]